MKNELTPVHVGDVLVLTSGEIVYVMDVDPLNKLKQDDRNRNCNCRFGHIYKKGEETKKDWLFSGLVEDARHNQVIVINVSKMKNFTLAELYPMIATNLGTVPHDKMAMFKKLSNDYFDMRDY